LPTVNVNTQPIDSDIMRLWFARDTRRYINTFLLNNYGYQNKPKSTQMNTQNTHASILLSITTAVCRISNRGSVVTDQTGWPQSRRKNSLSFPGFSRAMINLLIHRLSQQKVNEIMTFTKGHDDPVYPVNSCFTQIRVFEWRTKTLCYNFSLRVHRIPCEFSEYSMFREILEYSRFVATLSEASQFLDEKYDVSVMQGRFWH